MLKIVFAVSANKNDGLGHFKRSRALLYALSGIGDNINIKYLCQCDDQLIKQYEWPVNSAPIRLQKKIQISNFKKLLKYFLGGGGESILIVDSYNFQKYQLLSVTKKCKSILVLMDDIGSDKLHANLIINQSSQDVNLYSSKNIKYEKILIGAKYTLIEKDYIDHRKTKSSENIEVIGVVLGGGGSMELVSQIIQCILSLRKNYFINIVLGPLTDNYNLFKSDYINYIKSPKNLVEFIGSSDLVITAAGSTIWEICAIGTPLVAIKIADNQKEIIDTIIKEKIGYVAEISKLNMQLPVIISRMEKKVVRENILKNQHKLIDGKGAMRVSEEIVNMAGYKHNQVEK